MSQMPPVDPVLDMPMPEEPPAWPKVIGIISIVWGSLLILLSACGLASPLLLGWASKMAEKDMGPMPGPMMPSPAQLVLVGAGLLWAVLLLGAGIATVSRTRVGRTLHLAYAALSLLTALPSLALTVNQQMEMARWVAANPSSKWAQRASPVGNAIGLGVGVVLGVGYPIFCLAWFARRKHSPDVNAPDAPVA